MCYFSKLNVTGVGILNSVRIVEDPMRIAPPTYFMSFVVPHGFPDANGKSETTPFYVRVQGEEARKIFEDLVRQYPLLKCGNPKKRPKTSFSFKVQEIRPSTYERVDRETKELQITQNIEGILVEFRHIKIDGQWFYRNPNFSVKRSSNDDVLDSDEVLAPAA
ncbi:MAG: DUF3577 domain-containing protein [Neisseriaceae bacterium]|nr:DUF3577 domain-containing protein [Neisseriaceae bacterium]